MLLPSAAKLDHAAARPFSLACGLCTWEAAAWLLAPELRFATGAPEEEALPFRRFDRRAEVAGVLAGEGPV